MSDENDINKLLEHFDPLFLIRISMCRISVEETREIVQKLNKVEVNIGDGLTLLHQAASFGRPDLVRFLCDAGHSTEVVTIHGETPLDQAAWRGQIHSAMQLLMYNANIDSQTHGKYTPLHRCAYYGHPRLASLFILGGANQTIVDENGQTAYEVAVTQRNEELMRILKPVIDSDGRNISGMAYATNNPTHPNFRPEAREAFFALYAMNQTLESQGGGGGGDDDEWEDVDEDEEEGNEGEGGGNEDNGE